MATHRPSGEISSVDMAPFASRVASLPSGRIFQIPSSAGFADE
jgi:hypothetical protein